MDLLDKTKYLIVHADDAGLCHSENMATIQALKGGIVSSYSIMAPCSGFDEIAHFAKNNPQFDYGVHLTLTCEWESHRFGPVLPISEVPTLVDENGHFFKTRNELKSKASVNDIKKELEAQVKKSLAFGLTPSHLDSHMYSVAISAEVFSIYKELGIKYGLPVFMNKEVLSMVTDENYINQNDFLIEHLFMGNFADFKNGRLQEYYFDTLDNLKSGINILLLHPAFDDKEMKEITINHPNFGSKWRQIDFSFCTSEKANSKIIENNLKLINWKDIQKSNIYNNTST